MVKKSVEKLRGIASGSSNKKQRSSSTETSPTVSQQQCNPQKDSVEMSPDSTPTPEKCTTHRELSKSGKEDYVSPVLLSRRDSTTGRTDPHQQLDASDRQPLCKLQSTSSGAVTTCKMPTTSSVTSTTCPSNNVQVKQVRGVALNTRKVLSAL